MNRQSGGSESGKEEEGEGEWGHTDTLRAPTA